MIVLPSHALKAKHLYLCSCRYDFRRSVFTFPVYISNDENGELLGWELELPQDNYYIFVPKEYSPRLAMCLECYGVCKSRGSHDERPIYAFGYAIQKR